MQTYKFLGIDKQGKRIAGEVDGISLQDVEFKLETRGLDLINLKIKHPPTYRRFISAQTIKRKDIIHLTIQLEQLLSAGVPLIEVLAELKSSLDNPRIQEIMLSVYQAVEAGESFSKALEAYKNHFGEVYLALIQAGESTGNLPVMLSDLVAMLQWEDELVSKSKKVMIYPIILALVITSVTLLMMLFVVPELLLFIQEMGSEPSLATQSLIATSSFIQSYAIYFLPLIIFCVLAYKVSLKNIKFRLFVDSLILRFPLLGNIFYKIKLARISHSLSVIYNSGVGIAEAIKMSSKTADNTYLESKLNKARERILVDGDSIYQSFELAQVFPSMGLKMIKIGEQSKSLDQALQNISYFYDREAKEAIDKLEPTIGPLLTIIMAVIIGWVMFAVLGPIYSTISEVNF